MASFAEMIMGQAMQSAGKATDGLAQSLAKGAELAQHAEQIKTQRQQLQMEQDKLEQARIFKGIDFIQKIDEFKDPEAQAGIIKMAPAVFQSMGLNVPKEHLNFLMKSPENRARLATAAEMMYKKQITAAELTAIVQDPTIIPKIPPKQAILLKQAGFTPEAIASMPAEEKASLYQRIGEAAKETAGFAAQEKKSDATQSRFDAAQFTQVTKDFGSTLDSNLDKLKPTKMGLRKTYSLLDPMVEKIKSGEKLNAMDLTNLTAASESIARAVNDAKGTLAEGDVNRLLREQGLEGKLSEFLASVTSSPDPQKVARLYNMVKMANRTIDQSLQSEFNVIRSRIRSHPALRDDIKAAEGSIGIDAAEKEWLAPLSSGKKKKAGPQMFSLGGKQFTREQLEAVKRDRPELATKVDSVLSGSGGQ